MLAQCQCGCAACVGNGGLFVSCKHEARPYPTLGSCFSCYIASSFHLFRADLVVRVTFGSIFWLSNNPTSSCSPLLRDTKSELDSTTTRLLACANQEKGEHILSKKKRKRGTHNYKMGFRLSYTQTWSSLLSSHEFFFCLLDSLVIGHGWWSPITFYDDKSAVLDHVICASGAVKKFVLTQQESWTVNQ